MGKTDSGAASDRATASGIAALTGVPERSVTRALDAAGVKSDRKAGGYVVEDALAALVRHFREQAEAIDTEVQRDKAATIRAERETAEMIAAEKKGELIPSAASEIFWADAMIAVVDVVKRLPLSQAQKEAAVADLRKIRVKPKVEDE